MVQKESGIERDIEDTRAVMTEKIDMIENRMSQTMDDTKAKIDNVMEKVKGVQDTIDTAKSTIDNILETVKHTMEETIERVKYTSKAIEQVDQNPWIMFGSAVLTGYVLGGLGESGRQEGGSRGQGYQSAMETIEKSIDVNVSVRTAYNQWTQFEEFPRFMEGVEAVKQLDDTTLQWVANVGGERKEWRARITEQVPDHHIAWRSEGGEFTSGVVSFQALGPDKTRVTVRLNYEPKGLGEKLGDMLGIVSRRVQGDLERFKDFIESRGRETGAWRGTVR
jgi:uncharacterized membrane protein/ElaB/YqjD/DUF883 family membrane-anchored ribosome-binding protein